MHSGFTRHTTVYKTPRKSRRAYIFYLCLLCKYAFCLDDLHVIAVEFVAYVHDIIVHSFVI